MSQNNLNHYSDLAKYKIFDPANTSWPENVKDVQSALALIGNWARTDVGLPSATETAEGVSRIATQQEVNDGTVDDAFITPKTLKVRLGNPVATTAVLGLTQYATNEEAANLSLGTRSITASALGYVFNNVTASTTRFGTVKLTSSVQAQAGTDESSATSPARVKEMIAKFAPVAPSYATANETSLGLTKLATIGQTQQGTLRDGFAVSPYGFVNSRADESKVGTVRFATQAEGRAFASGTIAISPTTLAQIKASTGSYGICRLTSSYLNDANAAIAGSAPVVWQSRTINGKPLSSDITITAANVGAWTSGESDARYLFKGEGGNWSRTYASSVAAGSAHNIGTNLPVTGVGTIQLNVKFDRNNDSETNRYYYFDIRVNGVTVQSSVLNLYNSKGGSNGHSWRFEGYACGIFGVSVPPNATVQIVPTNIYLAMVSNCVLTVNN